MENNYNNNFATRENVSIALRMADFHDQNMGSYIENYPQPEVYNEDRTFGTIAPGQGNAALDDRIAATRQPKLHYPSVGRLPTKTMTGGPEYIAAPLPLSNSLAYVRDEMQEGVSQLTQMKGKPGERDQPIRQYKVPNGYMNHTKGGIIQSKKPVKEKKVKSTGKEVLAKISSVKPPAKKKSSSDDKKISGKFAILNKLL